MRRNRTCLTCNFLITCHACRVLRQWRKRPLVALMALILVLMWAWVPSLSVSQTDYSWYCPLCSQTLSPHTLKQPWICIHGFGFLLLCVLTYLLTYSDFQAVIFFKIVNFFLFISSILFKFPFWNCSVCLGVIKLEAWIKGCLSNSVPVWFFSRCFCCF